MFLQFGVCCNFCTPRVLVTRDTLGVRTGGTGTVLELCTEGKRLVTVTST